MDKGHYLLPFQDKVTFIFFVVLIFMHYCNQYTR